jgi:ribosomal-protein-alanine N-acetyltransferase
VIFTNKFTRLKVKGKKEGKFKYKQMISKSTILTTDRLLLQFPSLDEVPRVMSATKYEGFNDGMLWEPPETEGPIIKSLHKNRKAWDDGIAYNFSLIEKESKNFIGRISIRQEEEKDVWNVGFWTHPLEQGKGYMSEAVAAVLRFGFEQLNAQRIEACYATWNTASEKVLIKNGMQFIRHIKEGFIKKGKWVEENLLGIDRINWKG